MNSVTTIYFIRALLNNVRNVVQFNIFDLLSALALRTITTIEPDRTMKLSTSVVYSKK